MKPETTVGGQAVLEGVMMRAPQGYSIAVRLADGSISVQKVQNQPMHQRHKLLKLPVIRGFFILLDSLVLGIKALNFSANQLMSEEQSAQQKERSKLANQLYLTITIAISFALGIGLFLLAPLWLTNVLKGYIPIVESQNWMFNLVDGVLRIIIFLGYVLVISSMKDIRRVFMYHGAEHKAVYTYEANETLSIENARSKSTLHPRCGTSFLLIVMVLAILVFSMVPKESHFAIKFGARILFLPLIAGLSYEFIRFTSKHSNKRLIRMLMAPGLALQRLTTRQPTDDMLEVAIKALTEALDLKRQQTAEA